MHLQRILKKEGQSSPIRVDYETLQNNKDLVIRADRLQRKIKNKLINLQDHLQMKEKETMYDAQSYGTRSSK